MAERTVVSRQPHHLRALPRACETEGRGAVLERQASASVEGRADAERKPSDSVDALHADPGQTGVQPVRE